MFEDRLKSIDIFPLCEVLEEIEIESLDLSYNLIDNNGIKAIGA